MYCIYMKYIFALPRNSLNNNFMLIIYNGNCWVWREWRWSKNNNNNNNIKEQKNKNRKWTTKRTRKKLNLIMQNCNYASICRILSVVCIWWRATTFYFCSFVRIDNYIWRWREWEKECVANEWRRATTMANGEYWLLYITQHHHITTNVVLVLTCSFFSPFSFIYIFIFKKKNRIKKRDIHKIAM